MSTSFAIVKYRFDGTPDPGFGVGGLAVLERAGSPDALVQVESMTADSDRRLLVGGTIGGRLAVARTLPDGSADPSFGQDGLITIGAAAVSEMRGGAVAIDRQGQIYLAGSGRFGDRDDIVLARMHGTGQLDASFGTRGLVQTRLASVDSTGVSSLTLDSRQRPIVAGTAIRGDSSLVAFARYSSDGSLDTTFGGDGKVLLDFFSATWERGYSVDVDDEDRVVTCGGSGGTDSTVIVSRHHADGTLDPTFDGDGKVITQFYSSRREFGSAVAVDRRGRVVVGGYARTLSAWASDESGRYRTAAFLLVRLLPDGRLDASFDYDGKALVGNPLHYGASPSLALSVQGLMYVGGVGGPPTVPTDPAVPVTLAASSVGVVRCTDLGSPDSGFGDNGLVEFRRSGVTMVRGGNGLVSLPGGEPAVAFAAITSS